MRLPRSPALADTGLTAFGTPQAEADIDVRVITSRK
jgi:hypothetical protein